MSATEMTLLPIPIQINNDVDDISKTREKKCSEGLFLEQNDKREAPNHPNIKVKVVTAKDCSVVGSNNP